MNRIAVVFGIALATVIGCTTDPTSGTDTTIAIQEARLSRTYKLTGCGLTPVKPPPCSLYSSGHTSLQVDSSSVVFLPDGTARLRQATRRSFNPCYLSATPCVEYDTTVTDQVAPYAFTETSINLQATGANFITRVASGFGAGEPLPARVPQDWQGPDSLLLLYGGGSWMGHLSVYKPVTTTAQRVISR